MEKTIKNYYEAVGFLESLGNLSGKYDHKKRLKNFKNFLAFLGNPQEGFKTIHITGTSGKGSVATMLHSILCADGKFAGVYTSPHTTTFCERVKAGDRYISEKDLVALANFLKEKMDNFLIFNTQRPISLNFFEASFVLALLYFQKIKCDYIVVEVGMGGRYDATNIFKKPAYTIITNIGRDHLQIIGPTLKDVAYEKVGIIKKGAPLLTGERHFGLLKIFAREMRKITNYELRVVDYRNLKNIKTGLDGTHFEYCGKKYNLRLLGEHQAQNAALAIECSKDLALSDAAIKNGLARAFYPARLEIINRQPLIILDGAHNEDKIKAAFNFIKKFTSHKSNSKSYLVLAASENKEMAKTIRNLVGRFDFIYLTRFRTPFRKCRDLAGWQKILGPSLRKKIVWRHSAKDALLDILSRLHNNDVVMATGSIFLAGELREHWVSEEKIIKSRKSSKR